MKRVLMTGAAGRVATQLRPLLAGAFEELILVDRQRVQPLYPGERAVRCNLRSQRALQKVLRNVDGVIHLSIAPHDGRLESLVSGNVEVVCRLFEAAREAGIRHVVLPSSMHVLGLYTRDEPVAPGSLPRPDSLYACTKSFAENVGALYATRYGMNVACLRHGHLTAELNDKTEPGNWTSPEDLANCIRAALDHRFLGFEVFHVVAPNAGDDIGQESIRRRLGVELKGVGPSAEACLAVIEEWHPRDHTARLRRGGQFASEGVARVRMGGARRLAISGQGSGDGHLWPTPEQQLLLQAALDPSDNALEAFAEWRQRVDVEQAFGWSSVRLLPLAYRNLAALNCTDPLMGRMKGMYRRSWFETNTLFHRVRPALARLASEGMDPVLLKGAPLAISAYRNLALRPMSDVDVWVPSERLPDADRILREDGWLADALDESRIRAFHALPYHHPDGGELDLHWHALHARSSVSATARLTGNCESLDFLGVALRQLRPAQSLIVNVMHGLRVNRESPVRWIADAVVLSRAHEAPIDWELVVEFGARQRVSRQLWMGLSYLQAHHALPVPGPVLSALANRRPGIMERVELAFLVDSREESQAFSGNRPLRKQLARAARVVEHERPLVTARVVAQYFAARTRTYKRFESGTARAIGRRIWKRIRKRISLRFA
ncbi:MAG: hypothetical protein JWO05_1301 [Gemmatimonadetes bacterium]|nr:hypothetical protein [Gemmatimonadota bacterium]